MNVVDVIIIALLILGGVAGFKAGVIKKLTDFIGMFVVIILAFLTVVAIPPAGLIRGFSGVLGAVCALAIMWVVAAIGIGANQLVLRNPLRTTTYVFGAYLVKLLIVLVAVAALRPISQVDNPTIFLVLVIAILLTTIGEAAVVSKSNRLIIGRI